MQQSGIAPDKHHTEMQAMLLRLNLLSAKVISWPLACVLAAVWVSGLVQTALYLDFFYYYILAWKNNKKLSLPS